MSRPAKPEAFTAFIESEGWEFRWGKFDEFLDDHGLIAGDIEGEFWQPQIRREYEIDGCTYARTQTVPAWVLDVPYRGEWQHYVDLAEAGWQEMLATA